MTHGKDVFSNIGRFGVVGGWHGKDFTLRVDQSSREILKFPGFFQKALLGGAFRRLQPPLHQNSATAGFKPVQVSGGRHAAPICTDMAHTLH
ncbi:hypothetical protein [Paraburkholderia sp. BCC1886]|uniref:hypothetical protein n=1 Tax=Paraburkholderia sp. BCC1886 TaxID=2562670 RepID=UPI00164265B2|nr:hypothetical protein [Paraburkholderia sp. BCC1886]